MRVHAGGLMTNSLVGKSESARDYAHRDHRSTTHVAQLRHSDVYHVSRQVHPRPRGGRGWTCWQIGSLIYRAERKQKNNEKELKQKPIRREDPVRDIVHAGSPRERNKSNKAIVDSILRPRCAVPSVWVPNAMLYECIFNEEENPFPAVGNAACHQHAGGGPSHGHGQRAQKIW